MNRNGKKAVRRPVALTEMDLSTLKSIVRTAKRYLTGRTYIEELDEKLEEAELVPSDKVPQDQVEIATSVCITDLDRSEQKVYKLVYPRDANYGDCISVLAPLGSALFGRHVGEVVEVHAPARTRKVRIDGIVAGRGQ